MLDAGPLALIVRAGAGVNTIDVAGGLGARHLRLELPGQERGGGRRAGPRPDPGARSPHSRTTSPSCAPGAWNKKEYAKARGLHGRTLGLLGFGNIGQEVARARAGVRDAGRGLEPALRRRPPPSASGRRGRSSACRVRRRRTRWSRRSRRRSACTWRCAKDTRGFVDAALLSHAQPGAFVDQHRAGRGGRPGGARAPRSARRGCASASTCSPPSRPAATGAVRRSDSSQLPGVYGTHHIGASTDQAQEAIAAETVRIVRTFKDTGRVPNVVNLAQRTPATHMLVVRHRDRPGVLAHVFGELRAARAQRAGDRERHLRRRAGRRGPHQPRQARRPTATVAAVRRTPTSSTCSSSSLVTRGPSRESASREPRACPCPRKRPFNFSAGPAVLPDAGAARQAQRDLVALPGVGMSVLEISHRSKTFEGILARTEADLRALGGVPANYKVLFLQGGASLQFSMVPLNLLTPGGTADYIVTGGWAQKAVKEAQRVGTVHIAGVDRGARTSRASRGRTS